MTFKPTLIAAACMLALTAGAPAQAQSKKELEAMRKEMQQLRAEMEQLRAELLAPEDREA